MRTPTKKQLDVLRFIEDFRNKNAYTPSVVEIAKRMGWKSQNSVYCHLTALTKKGLLVSQFGESRTHRATEAGRRALRDA